MRESTVDYQPEETGRTSYSAERLFIYGLRCVQNGFYAEHFDQWREVWEGYRRYFGSRDCTPVLDALWRFVRNYRRYAKSPTGFHRLDCPRMARDEYLSMALLSALQHHDEACVRRCLDEIARPAGRAALQATAWQLGAEYLGLGQRFFPVSETDVETTLITTEAIETAKTATRH
ncbi:MAG: hypothetical protein AAGF82_08800 [Pseudomonadota bacterium]